MPLHLVEGGGNEHGHVHGPLPHQGLGSEAQGGLHHGILIVDAECNRAIGIDEIHQEGMGRSVQPFRRPPGLLPEGLVGGAPVQRHSLEMRRVQRAQGQHPKPRPEWDPAPWVTLPAGVIIDHVHPVRDPGPGTQGVPNRPASQNPCPGRVSTRNMGHVHEVIIVSVADEDGTGFGYVVGGHMAGHQGRIGPDRHQARPQKGRIGEQRRGQQLDIPPLHDPPPHPKVGEPHHVTPLGSHVDEARDLGLDAAETPCGRQDAHKGDAAQSAVAQRRSAASAVTI